MQKCALVLPWLALVGFGRRIQTSTEQVQHSFFEKIKKPSQVSDSNLGSQLDGTHPVVTGIPVTAFIATGPQGFSPKFGHLRPTAVIIEHRLGRNTPQRMITLAVNESKDSDDLLQERLAKVAQSLDNPDALKEKSRLEHVKAQLADLKRLATEETQHETVSQLEKKMVRLEKEFQTHGRRFTFKPLAFASSVILIALAMGESLGRLKFFVCSVGIGLSLFSVAGKGFTKKSAATAQTAANQSAGLMELLRFVTSTSAMVAAGMILTAIDKAFVGQVSSLQLASLGPAGAMYDCTSYILTFLNTATLSLLAAAPLSQRNAVRSHALFFSIVSGVFLSIGLVIQATPAVELLGASTSMLPFATIYLQLRALGAPIDRLSSVCTQFCLAEKDGVAPLVATLISAIFNVFGDYALCPKFGTAGAALASIAASAISAAYLVTSLRRRDLWPRDFRWPSFADFRPFAAFAGPVFFILILKVLCFTALTAAATMLGTTSGAAHQVLVSIFFVCGISLGQPLSWAAQSYLPGTRAGQADRRCTTRALLGITSGAIGLGAGLAALMARFCLGWFTQDPAVQMQAVIASPGVVLSLGLYIGLLSLEGFSIALQKLRPCVTVSALMTSAYFVSIWWQCKHGLLTLAWLWKMQASVLFLATSAMATIVVSGLRAERAKMHT